MNYIMLTLYSYLYNNQISARTLIGHLSSELLYKVPVIGHKFLWVIG